MEYYAAVKRKELLPFATAGMALETIMLFCIMNMRVARELGVWPALLKEFSLLPAACSQPGPLSFPLDPLALVKLSEELLKRQFAYYTLII